MAMYVKSESDSKKTLRGHIHVYGLPTVYGCCPVPLFLYRLRLLPVCIADQYVIQLVVVVSLCFRSLSVENEHSE